MTLHAWMFTHPKCFSILVAGSRRECAHCESSANLWTRRLLHPLHQQHLGQRTKGNQASYTHLCVFSSSTHPRPVRKLEHLRLFAFRVFKWDKRAWWGLSFVGDKTMVNFLSGPLLWTAPTGMDGLRTRLHAECSGLLPKAHVVDLQMSIATKVQQNITVRNGWCEDIFHELIWKWDQRGILLKTTDFGVTFPPFSATFTCHVNY